MICSFSNHAELLLVLLCCCHSSCRVALLSWPRCHSVFRVDLLPWSCCHSVCRVVQPCRGVTVAAKLSSCLGYVVTVSAGFSPSCDRVVAFLLGLAPRLAELLPQSASPSLPCGRALHNDFWFFFLFVMFCFSLFSVT